MIPYGRQDIQNDDIDAVLSVLRSDFLTQGPLVPSFETALSNYIKVPHVVAVSSATAGLHISCLALGLGPGGLLWTTPNTFVATANAALYCGADVDFVDIDPSSYCMSYERLAEKLEQTKKRGKKLPDIVVPVHFAGQSCDMESIFELSKIYGFKIIEDASHAIGGDADGGKIGHSIYSDVTVFSFHPVKIITTGEGGAITTRNPELALRLSELRSHGITRDPHRMVSQSDGAWYYQMIDLGYNYRLTDMQAALGLSQLSKIDHFISRRRELASNYDKLLVDLPLKCPWQNPDGKSSFHLYPIVLPSNFNRKEIFEKMRSCNIGVNVHYIPVHTQPFYLNRGFKYGDFPNSEQYYNSAITIPLFSSMTDDQQMTVFNCLNNLLN